MSEDIDGKIIADQERAIARLRAELETAESLAADDFETAVERFNPPDDDSTSVYTVLSRAADFIEAEPCQCTPAMVEDFDACARCHAIGRIGNIRVGR